MPSTAVPANSGYTLQVTGATTNAQPAGTVTAAAVEFETVSTAAGVLQAYASGSSRPATSVDNWGAGSQTRSDLASVQLSSGGAITVYNESATSINVVVDLEGWYGSVLPPSGGNLCHLAGSRTAESMIAHSLNDREQFAFDPATGNGVLTGSLLHLTGVGQSVDSTGAITRSTMVA